MFKVFHKLNFGILLLTLLSIGSPLFLRAQKIQHNNGIYSLLDEKGNVLLDHCEDILSYSKDSYFIFKKSDLYGVYDLKSKSIGLSNYEEIQVINETKGLLLATKNGKKGVLTKEGKIVYPFKIDEMRNYDEEVIIINQNQNKKDFLFSLKELKIISKGYERLYLNVSENIDWAVEAYDKGKRFLLDKKDGAIISNKYEDIEDYAFVNSPSLIRVKINDKMGVINTLGKEIVPPIYKQISALYEVVDVSDETPKVIVYMDEKDKIGFIQNDGQVITPPVYDSLGYDLNFTDDTYFVLSEDYNAILCYKGNKIDLLNFITQKRINTESFDSIVGVNKLGVLVTVKNNQYQFVDLKKGDVPNKTFDKVEIVDPYFIVTKNQKLGVVGSTGNREIAPLIYDEISFDEDKKEFVAKIGSIEKRIRYKY